jgi:hypothetical protein
MSEETQTQETETQAQEPVITAEQFAEMQAEIDRLRKHNETILSEKKLATEAARKAAEDAAKKSGDIEALEKSWAEREAQKLAERESELQRRDEWLRDMTVNATASRLAAEMAVQGSSIVLERHLRDRLGMEIRDGKPTTVVLDADGRPSALSVDDLRKEFMANPAFAPLIAETRASGAGGVGQGRASGQTSQDVSKWSADQKSLYIRENGLDAWKTLIAGKSR